MFGFVYLEYDAGRDERAALAPYTPSADNRDPSLQIKGTETKDTSAANHVAPDQRVAYETSPPLGGPHDGIWADCSGTVYDTPVRTENMVHSMEHSAVWIAYDPAAVTGPALESLTERVGQEYTMLSPYPGLSSPISLQSWGHQLRVERADDPRIDQFIQALKVNQYTHPEVGATCQVPPDAFDPADPPPFDPTPPGPDAVPVGSGAGRGTGAPSGG